MLLAAIITIIGCENNENLNTENLTLKEPLVDFTTNKPSYEPGDTVYFINLSKNCNAFKWDFGDEENSQEKEPQKTYSIPGDFIGVDYAVKLTGYSVSGDSASIKKHVKVGYRMLDYIEIQNLIHPEISSLTGDSASIYVHFGTYTDPDLWDIEENRSFRSHRVSAEQPVQSRFDWSVTYPTVILSNEGWFIKIYLEKGNNTEDVCLVETHFNPTQSGKWNEDFREGSLNIETDHASIQVGFRFSNLT